MSKSNPPVSLQIMTNCPMCDFKYSKEDINVVNRKDELTLVHLKCQRCKSAVMMMVITESFGITSASVMTDIIQDDLKKISGDLINGDDVLEVHKFLKNK